MTKRQAPPKHTPPAPDLVAMAAKIRALPDTAFLWLCAEVAFEHGARFPDRYNPRFAKKPGFFTWHEA